MQLFKVLSACLILMALGCSREKGEASKVVFQIPDSQSLEKVSDYSALGAPILSELNCFYVAVAGPEPELSNLRCGRKNLKSEMEAILQVGIVFGGVVRSSVTQSIELEVPSGDKRSFYLLAMKHDDAGNCVDFSRRKSFFNDAANMSSNVWVIGKSEGNKLTAGAVQTIPMELTSSENDWIKECESSAVREPVLDASLPSHAVLKNVSAPGGSKMQWNSCSAVEVELRSPLGHALPATGPVTVSLLDRKLVGSLLSPNFTPQTSYSTHEDCVSQSSGANSFAISAGVKNVLRWLKTPASAAYVGKTYQLRIQTDSAAIRGAVLKRDQEIAEFEMFEGMSSFTHLNIKGPRLVVKDVCYAYHVERTTTPGVSLSPIPFKVFGKTRGGKRLAREYSDVNCTTELDDTDPALATARSVFYIKFDMDSGAYPLDFKLVQFDPSVAAATLATGALFDVQVIGDNVATGLMLDIPRIWQRPVAGSSCVPFRFQYANAYGALVSPIAGAAMTWLLTVTDVSPVGPVTHPILFHSDSSCSMTLSTSVTMDKTEGTTAYMKIYDNVGSGTSIGPRELRLGKGAGNVFENSHPFYIY